MLFEVYDTECINCAHCNIKFTRNAENQLYCTQRCRDRAAYRRKRQRDLEFYQQHQLKLLQLKTAP